MPFYRHAQPPIPRARPEGEYPPAAAGGRAPTPGSWCSRRRCCPDCASEPNPSLAPDDGRTGWHFSFFSLPNLPELLLAGRERPFWTYFARRQMWDPSALTEDDIDGMVRSIEQPGGTQAILEMYRARQIDADQNRPHYADPVSCPVLAVGAQRRGHEPGHGDRVRPHARRGPAAAR